jgi:hypothetical protein
MKKCIIYIVILFSNNLTLFSQKIELYGGANKNLFYDFNNDYPHYSSNYKSKYGFTAGFGIDSVKIDWLTCRFNLQLDKYSGKLDVSEGGLGGGSTTVANIDKTVISLGVFPINIRIIKRLDINLGLIITELIHESFNGTCSGWLMNQPDWSYQLQDKYRKYSSSNYFGIQGRIAYNIKMTESMWLTPQYLYYLGLTNEFVKFPEDTRSMRHYFCIGIKKKIK